MLANEPAIVHVAVYDTLADWEVGYATAHLRNPDWQVSPGAYSVRTVGASDALVTTMGGLRVTPDLTLADLDPAASAMLILPGNNLWATDEFAPFVAAARAFLEAGTPVAAICGATGALAMAGLLDDRQHTSNAREFLAATGYAGGALYRDDPAVTDGPLITGSGVYPVEFARAIFEKLGVYSEATLESWFKLYRYQDPAGYFELASSR